MDVKIDDLNSLDWDDSALIRAYNRGMSLRGKDLDQDTDTAKARNPKKKWKIGDHCRAVYYGDKSLYEAKIIDISGNTCLVEFLGYNEEAEVELKSLEKSLGKRAIKEQKKNARNILFHDADESENGEDTMHEHNASHGHHHHHHSKRHHRNNESHMFDHSANYTAAESTFYNACTPVHLPEMAPMMPPVPAVAPPPPPDVFQNPSLNAMLTAWYMAGYYTGLHQASKPASQQHCHCHQAFN